MTLNCLGTLASPELLQPIWNEIDSLDEREHYKEAYQYLRFVTKELTLLHEATIAVSSLLNVTPDVHWPFEQLQKQLEQQLQPIRDSSLLRYIESLRTVLQAAHQALHTERGGVEPDILITELCANQCAQLEREELDQQLDSEFESDPAILTAALNTWGSSSSALDGETAAHRHHPQAPRSQSAVG